MRAWTAIMSVFVWTALLSGCTGPSHTDEDAEALTDSPIRLTTEAELTAGKFEREILGYWETHRTRGSFLGKEGPEKSQPNIVYDVIRPDVPSDGALVIVHGMGESSLRYAELVFDLHQSGLPLTVYVLNHRGQGFSDRLLPDPMKCHADEFEYYVDDLATFVESVVQPRSHRHLFAFAHSMGGGIFTRYLQRYPDVFQHVVLSSPLHGLNTRWMPEWALKVLADVVGRFTASDYFFTQAEPEPVTSSPARAEIANILHRRFPESQVGGVTWGWTKEVLDATRGPVRREANKIRAQITMFRAANDDLVDVASQDEVCSAINGTMGRCELVSLTNVKHEVWNERDEVRSQVLGRVFQSFKDVMKR